MYYFVYNRSYFQWLFMILQFSKYYWRIQCNFLLFGFVIGLPIFIFLLSHLFYQVIYCGDHYLPLLLPIYYCWFNRGCIVYSVLLIIANFRFVERIKEHKGDIFQFNYLNLSFQLLFQITDGATVHLQKKNYSDIIELVHF